MGWDWAVPHLPARGFTPGGPLPESWKEALAKVMDDLDWQPAPVHIEEFLEWYALAEDKDEWTYPRIVQPEDAGQEGDKVLLHQKWWILLFPAQDRAYRVKPVYRSPLRPRSRPGTPAGARWDGRSARQKGPQPPSSGADHQLSPPPLGSGGSAGGSNPYRELD